MKTPVKPSKDLTTSLPALNQIVIPPQPYDRLSITDPYRLEKNGNWKRPLPRRGRRGIVQEPFSAVLSILNEQSILTRYHSTMGSGSALRGHTKRTERPRRPTRRAGPGGAALTGGPLAPTPTPAHTSTASVHAVISRWRCILVLVDPVSTPINVLPSFFLYPVEQPFPSFSCSYRVFPVAVWPVGLSRRRDSATRPNPRDPAGILILHLGSGWTLLELSTRLSFVSPLPRRFSLPHRPRRHSFDYGNSVYARFFFFLETIFLLKKKRGMGVPGCVWSTWQQLGVATAAVARSHGRRGRRSIGN